MKYIILFLTFTSSQFILPDSDQQAQNELDSTKEKAFELLSQKCNVCHKTDNPSKVFTLDNMEGFSKKIKRQVFVFKRMPKGKDITLTKEEKQILKDWIKSNKNK